MLSSSETNLLYRPRAAHASEVVWTADDAPLLDESLALLGPRPSHRQADSVRTYGHIVVDEAQDLSPMQLRMISRRSLNGSMTVVGDIAQATTAWGHDSWDTVVEHLPANIEPRFAELTIGYRLPEPIMEVAAQVLDSAVPGLVPPRSIRTEGQPPRFASVLGHRATPPGNGQGRETSPSSLVTAVVHEVKAELGALANGNLAVICHAALTDAISEALTSAGVEHGLVYERGLESQVTIVPVELIKGLEVDTAVVVEPADICEKLPKGMRALYVAMTRATPAPGGGPFPPAARAASPQGGMSRWPTTPETSARRWPAFSETDIWRRSPSSAPTGPPTSPRVGFSWDADTATARIITWAGAKKGAFAGCGRGRAGRPLPGGRRPMGNP